MKVCDIYSVTIYRHSLQEMHTSTMCLTHTESFCELFFPQCMLSSVMIKPVVLNSCNTLTFDVKHLNSEFLTKSFLPSPNSFQRYSGAHLTLQRGQSLFYSDCRSGCKFNCRQVTTAAGFIVAILWGQDA